MVNAIVTVAGAAVLIIPEIASELLVLIRDEIGWVQR